MSSLNSYLEHPAIEKLIKDLEPTFAKLPKLPQSIIDILVTITPYLALLGAIASLIIGPFAVLGTVFSLLTLNPAIVFVTLLSAVMLFVQAVLMFMAFKPLKAREYRGWYLMFVSELISLAQSIVGLILNLGGIVGIVIGFAIGFYLLFQVKKEYKK
jgi:hypothetical protein